MTSREDNRRLAEAYNEAMGIGDTNLDDELTDDPNDFTHDYAACQDPICPLCEASAMDTRQARRRLILKFAIGVQPITRRRAGVIRVWPQDR